MKPIKLFIDDIRPAPEGWHLARTVTEAIRFLSQNYQPIWSSAAGTDISEISIDHDISHPGACGKGDCRTACPEDFTAVAHHIVALYGMEAEIAGMLEFQPPRNIPKITIHSSNPVGAKRIQAILKDFPDVEITPYPVAKRIK